MRALGWWSQPSLRPLERRAAARRPSDLRQAAVHRELAGGHEAAVIRREKGRPRRDFRRFGHALQRIHRGEHLQALLRSEEHTSELQSLMRISYAVFCLKKKNKNNIPHQLAT